MKPPPGGWNKDYWDNTLKSSVIQTENEIRAEFFAQIRNGTMTPQEAEARHFHELWTRISQKQGLDYSRVEHGYND
jgi:hypothetical protein